MQITNSLIKIGLIFILGLAGSTASGMEYPARPITVIVPFAPGAAADSLARIVAKHMKTSLGQPIIVENVTGAGGTIGLSRGVRAPADGYTLTFGNWTSHVGGPAVYPLAVDVLKDLEPVARLTDLPMMLVGSAALPADNIKQLIEWLRTNPGRASAATIGGGSPAHLCMVTFQNSAGIKIQLVPYRGGAPAIQDVIAGHIPLFCGEAMNILPHVSSGKVKPYAVLSKNRWFAAPEIPTGEEAGLSALSISFWSGLWAPKGTPKEVIVRLSEAVREALADTTIRQRLTQTGFLCERRNRRGAG